MEELAYYVQHSPLTDPGTMGHLFSGLPPDAAALARVIGGVLVHRDCTQRFGFAIPEDRRDEANTRHVEAILAYLGTLDERRPEERFAGTCRDFAVLLCAMLRAAGVPARARAGFAGYFADGFFDDHWVVEVWGGERGWHLIDAQVASVPAGIYTDAELDPLDVPRDAFLVATLPWDQWGLIPVHYDELESADVDLLDRVAAVSAAGGPLRQAAEVYRVDPRLPAPAALSAPAGSHVP